MHSVQRYADSMTEHYIIDTVFSRVTSQVSGPGAKMKEVAHLGVSLGDGQADQRSFFPQGQQQRHDVPQ
jgi:hypothetical protein